jgi:toxin ParE1/3/4
MTIRYRAQALRDIAEIYSYLEERSPDGARHVLQAIRDGILLIGEQPRAGIPSDDPSIRVKVVRRYRYKVFYAILEDETVEILHVRHTSREPWRGGK